jgi:hypothetical protein
LAFAYVSPFLKKSVHHQLDLRDELLRQDEIESRALADISARITALHSKWDEIERLARLSYAQNDRSRSPTPPSPSTSLSSATAAATAAITTTVHSPQHHGVKIFQKDQ